MHGFGHARAAAAPARPVMLWRGGLGALPRAARPAHSRFVVILLQARKALRHGDASWWGLPPGLFSHHSPLVGVVQGRGVGTSKQWGPRGSGGAKTRRRRFPPAAAAA